MKKPNIVFFFTDDQRFDTIHALGNDLIKTPNIDRLVKNGTSFVNAHIPCGTSPAVCMPSRAMLHTGRGLFHIDREGQRIPEEHKTLGEALQKNGYETFGTGKWHNGTGSYARSFTAGGEIFFGGMEDHWNVPVHAFDPTGKYESRAKRTRNCFFDNATTDNVCDHVVAGKHSSELFADAVTDYIENYTSDKPYFIYVSFMAPHDPRTMPEKFLEMYSEDDITLPPNFREEHEFDYGIRDVRDEVLADYPRDPSVVKRHIKEYLAMITHLDNKIGKVMRAVDEKNSENDTLFIFAGDNGLSVGQHGLMGKQNNYEHSVRVPLIFSGPGIPEGEKREAFAYIFDIFPTLCDLTGSEIPDSVEGKSLVRAINHRDDAVRNELYFAYTDKIRSIKNRQYKLIEYASENCRKTQLFDLENDPWETDDLSGKKENEEVIEALRKSLLKQRDEWDDVSHDSGRAFWKRYEDHDGRTKA